MARMAGRASQSQLSACGVPRMRTPLPRPWPDTGSLFTLLGLQVSDTRNEKRVRQFLVALERHGVEEQIECDAVARNTKGKIMLAFLQLHGPPRIPGNIGYCIHVTREVFVRIQGFVLFQRRFLPVNR